MWLFKTSSNLFIRIKYFYYYYYCWTFIEGLCQWLLKNCARDCWTILPGNVEQSCQWLLKNCASDCWITMPATVQRVNALGNTFQGELVSYKSSQLITIRDKLVGFSVVRFLLKCIYEQTVVYVRKYFSVETCALQKPVSWFKM